VETVFGVKNPGKRTQKLPANSVSKRGLAKATDSLGWKAQAEAHHRDMFEEETGEAANRQRVEISRLGQGGATRRHQQDRIYGSKASKQQAKMDK
jgi:hypothetical protein